MLLSSNVTSDSKRKVPDEKMLSADSCDGAAAIVVVVDVVVGVIVFFLSLLCLHAQNTLCPLG